MTLGLRALALSTSLALAVSLPAFADKSTEDFVRVNANAALKTLNNSTLNDDQRAAEFEKLMNRFADIDKLAMFVIGKYGRQFSDADLKTYKEVYNRYAMAVYEAQLDQYRGQEIVVTGSTDLRANDSIVESVVKRPQGDLTVKWRVMTVEGKSGQPDIHQVVDVALDLDGNVPWLAIEQRAQFLSLLDRSNGSAKALMAKINEMITKLDAEAKARRMGAVAPASGASQGG